MSAQPVPHGRMPALYRLRIPQQRSSPERRPTMNNIPNTPKQEPSVNDDITVRDIILWNRIGRISVLLAKRLNIEPERAFDIFYESDTCEHLHDETSGLYLMGDLYVVDEVMIELQRKQG